MYIRINPKIEKNKRAMRIDGTHYRSIWIDRDPGVVKVIDQRYLPFDFRILDLKTPDDAFQAIAGMAVRGAPLIGATAAFGIYLAALRSAPANWCEELEKAAETLISARPTAVNLSYAVSLMAGAFALGHAILRSGNFFTAPYALRRMKFSVPKE